MLALTPAIVAPDTQSNPSKFLPKTCLSELCNVEMGRGGSLVPTVAHPVTVLGAGYSA